MRGKKRAEWKDTLDRLLLVLCWHRGEQAYYVLRYAATIRFPGHHLHKGDLLGVRGPLQPDQIRAWTRDDESFGPLPWPSVPVTEILRPVLRAVVPPAMNKGRLRRSTRRGLEGPYACMCPRRSTCCKRH